MFYYIFKVRNNTWNTFKNIGMLILDEDKFVTSSKHVLLPILTATEIHGCQLNHDQEDVAVRLSP